MVVFPDPPFELIISVVFIFMTFAPFSERLRTQQDYAIVMPLVINYFTGRRENPLCLRLAAPSPPLGRPCAPRSLRVSAGPLAVEDDFVGLFRHFVIEQAGDRRSKVPRRPGDQKI